MRATALPIDGCRRIGAAQTVVIQPRTAYAAQSPLAAWSCHPSLQTAQLRTRMIPSSSSAAQPLVVGTDLGKCRPVAMPNVEAASRPTASHLRPDAAEESSCGFQTNTTPRWHERENTWLRWAQTVASSQIGSHTSEAQNTVATSEPQQDFATDLESDSRGESWMRWAQAVNGYFDIQANGSANLDSECPWMHTSHSEDASKAEAKAEGQQQMHSVQSLNTVPNLPTGALEDIADITGSFKIVPVPAAALGMEIIPSPTDTQIETAEAGTETESASVAMLRAYGLPSIECDSDTLQDTSTLHTCDGLLSLSLPLLR